VEAVSASAGVNGVERTVTEPDAPATVSAPVEPAAAKHGLFTTKQWVGVGIVLALALVGLGTIVVLAVRRLLGLSFMQSFVAGYPGAYDLPSSAPVGLPAWLNFQHFLNIFFMVLLIRAGLHNRLEKKPPAYWASRRVSGAKISINLWFHLALDTLWLVNGVVFIVLLFVTGQWMRIVPTSWSVFPNALSAGLQYLSLDWPVEHGWTNYNSLQQLMYFLVVFIAAPLAAVTGFRMTFFWNSKWTRASAVYPVELARKIHFPTMEFFGLFIAVHIFLVFATGAQANLNHMFAARDGSGWSGLLFFLGAAALTAGAWLAARPIVLAPIARLFGTVSSR
jgi:thiosulfate reductase cytochrome b subunit